MPQEVTINIESSLAAMAFVIADQQQHLKEIREQKSAVEAQYANYLHSTAEELNSLHKEIDGLTHDCSDKVAIIGNREKEIDVLRKVYDFLYDVNVDMCKQVDKLKGKILDWHEIGDYDMPLQGYELPFNIEDYPQAPCVLLKIEYIKDGCFDNANHPISINTQNVVFAYPCIENRRYTLNHNDTYTKAIAWCLVSDKNF